MKNLKLNQIAERDLSEKQMNAIKGGTGDCCGCACAHANSGGSSEVSNGNANKAGRLNSSTHILRYWCEDEGVWVVLH
jgi:natural product precursor